MQEIKSSQFQTFQALGACEALKSRRQLAIKCLKYRKKSKLKIKFGNLAHWLGLKTVFRGSNPIALFSVLHCDTVPFLLAFFMLVSVFPSRLRAGNISVPSVLGTEKTLYKHIY